jgi:hypothetical protein
MAIDAGWCGVFDGMSASRLVVSSCCFFFFILVLGVFFVVINFLFIVLIMCFVEKFFQKAEGVRGGWCGVEVGVFSGDF